MFAFSQARDELEDVHPTACADDAVQARHFLHERIAVALRQASGRDHHLVAALDLDQFAQRLDRLFFRRVDESAGIDDQHFRRPGVADAAHAARFKDLRHALAVDRVLGAAQAE